MNGHELACSFLEQACKAGEVKQTPRRRGTAQGVPDTDDLVRRCYGSGDFSEGVAAFNAGRPPVWRGR